MVELELLGVKWAMKKCHNFLFGLPHFQLVVDHLPLVSILDKQTLDCVDNARLQRLKSHTSPYNFTTIWRKGKEHRIPDALSCSPVQDPEPDDLEEDKEIYGYVCLVQRTAAMAIERECEGYNDESLADPVLEEIRREGAKDDEYLAIIRHLRSESSTLPSCISSYKGTIDEICEDEGLLLFRQRLLIPRKLRKGILKKLHSSHQGIERTQRRARQTVFWPGITSDIKSTVEACQQCQRYRPSQVQEPLERDPLPTRVFEEVAGDFFNLEGHHYLAITDRYSGWLEIYDIGRCATAQDLIKCLVKQFSSYGCPTRLFSDGGRQFTAAETQEFLDRWGVRHRLSTAAYPQSNGLAESAVKSLKALLKKCGNKAQSEIFKEGLLELRNTPRAGGKSPAEIVFGHPLRSKVPAHHRAFDKKWLVTMDEHDHKMAEIASKAAEEYDKSSRTLPPLKIGMDVLIQNAQTKIWDRTGRIVSIGQSRFSDFALNQEDVSGGTGASSDLYKPNPSLSKRLVLFHPQWQTTAKTKMLLWRRG